MKKLHLTIISSLAFIGSMFPIVVFAQSGVQSYTSLAPITGFIPTQVGVTDLTAYLNGMFKLGIAIAGALAVIMIIFGGIQYMSSDAIGAKSEGKKKITAAITGLIVALGSYMLLNTLSPDLLKTDLNLQTVTVTRLSQMGPGAIAAGVYGPGGIIGTTGGNDGLLLPPWQDELGNTHRDYNNGYSLVTGTDGIVRAYDPQGNEVSGIPITSTRVGIDTDGRTDPGIDPTTHQGATSYQPNGQSLDATTDNYVVIPGGSGIPLGTPVSAYDPITGKTVVGVVGDVGPSANGFGEMSLHMVQEFGLQNGNKDSATNHPIQFTFFPPGK